MYVKNIKKIFSIFYFIPPYFNRIDDLFYTTAYKNL